MGGPRDPPAQTWREGGHTKEGLASPAEGVERGSEVRPGLSGHTPTARPEAYVCEGRDL